MYVGHFAAGLAIKAWQPKVPVVPILLGIGFMDIVCGLFVMTGLDRIVPNLQSGPYLYFDLAFIDWDHSLVMAVFWSLVCGAIFLRDRHVAAIAALASFSHFIADWLVHNSDLAWYPYSEGHLGLGLWGRLGTTSWLLEGLLAALLGAYAWRANARRGASSLWPCLVLLVLFVQMSPWWSPMRFVAMLGEPAAHLLGGALVAIGFIVPGLLLSWLVVRAERQARPV